MQLTSLYHLKAMTGLINTISLDTNSLQRVENATFAASQLEEVKCSSYPNLSRVLDARGGAKRKRLQLILEYLRRPEEYSFITGAAGDTRAYTDIPLRELVGRYGGSPQTYAAVLNLCCVCGLMIKHNPNHMDKHHNTKLDTDARQYAARQRGRLGIWQRKEYNARVYYHLPRWTAEVLQRAEELARQNTGTLTRMIDTYGEEAARASLDTGRTIPRDTERARGQIKAYVEKQLQRKGYTTKREILRGVHVLTSREIRRREQVRPETGERKTVNLDPVLTAYMPQLKQELGLYFGRPTAEIREQLREIYGAEITGREWIITAKDNAPDAPPEAREAR